MNKENMKAFVTVKIPVQWIKSLSYQRGSSGPLMYLRKQVRNVTGRVAA